MKRFRGVCLKGCDRQQVVPIRTYLISITDNNTFIVDFLDRFDKLKVVTHVASLARGNWKVVDMFKHIGGFFVLRKEHLMNNRYQGKPNKEIRRKLAEYGIYHWELADALGIHDATLCRWLRRELKDEDREKILSIIEELAR